MLRSLLKCKGKNYQVFTELLWEEFVAVMNTCLKLLLKIILLFMVHCIAFAKSLVNNESNVRNPTLFTANSFIHHASTDLTRDFEDYVTENSTSAFIFPPNHSSGVPKDLRTHSDKAFTTSLPNITDTPVKEQNESKFSSANANGVRNNHISPITTLLKQIFYTTEKFDIEIKHPLTEDDVFGDNTLGDHGLQNKNSTTLSTEPLNVSTIYPLFESASQNVPNKSTGTRTASRSPVTTSDGRILRGTTYASSTESADKSDLLSSTNDLFPSTNDNLANGVDTNRTNSASKNSTFHNRDVALTVSQGRGYSTVKTSYLTDAYEFTTVSKLPISDDQNIQTRVRNMTDHGNSVALSVSTNHTSSYNVYPLEYVKQVQHIAYTIAFPVLICIGCIVNIICIIVFMRPRMRSVPVNKYFLALSLSDLIVCLMNIPIVITTNGCNIRSYGAAFYYGHFGWSMIEVWQTVNFYTLLFLSYDRFLAVYFYKYFKEQDSEKILRLRYVITIVADIIIHLFFFINVNIECKDDKMPIEHCTPENFRIYDSYRFNNDQAWHKLYFVLNELAIRWLPGLLLVIFNASLIVAIAMGRLSNPTSTHRTKRRTEFRLTITLIGITSSFIICTFPNTINSVWFSDNLDEKCYGKHEVFRAVSNNLQLLEHVLHIAFLSMLIPSFRSELISFLTCTSSPDSQNETDQSSRDLQMYQINRRSGHSPFPNKSPSPSPYTHKRMSGSDVNYGSVNGLTPHGR
ncbi:uncharacterized protein [Palaemon carinicauda]|uniref:uncharacterized protein n=1 Tax=Palaemon carinicauda TaxID=392227 RepID=UPI0035B5E6D0